MKNWQRFENEVAHIYELLGADSVDKDCIIDGRQIDILVNTTWPDGTSVCLAIECKDLSRKVGVEEVTKFASLVSLLRSLGRIDKGILVARKGFTNRAKKLADNARISHITIETLRRSIVNFHPYLAQLTQYCEANYVTHYDCYSPLKATNEIGDQINSVERYFDKWLLSDKAQITVLGDYGTGKTTLAQRLAHRQVKHYLKNPTKERIPILVTLRDYMKEFKMSSLLRDILIDRFHVRLRDYSEIDRLNSTGCLVLILDGFDEMASQVDEGIMLRNFAEIKSLILPNSKIVLTCRTHYFKTSEQMHEVHQGSELYQNLDKLYGVKFLYLQPFSKNDIETYLQKRLPGGPWSSVYAKIRETYNLTELAGHPILLKMMAETLPFISREMINPGVLYAEYVKEWLNRDDWRTQMSHEQREEFACILAWYFHTKSISSMHYKNIPGIIREYLPNTHPKELDYFDNDVRTCNFLTRDIEGNYFFVHKSFLEFFVALQLLKDIRRQSFERFEHQLSPQIINFLADLIKAEDVTVEPIFERLSYEENRFARGNIAVLLCKLGRKLSNLSLVGASMKGAELQGIKLIDCDLSYADLSGVNFSMADLRRSILEGADLSFACFSKACLDDVNLKGSTCKGTSFVGASLERIKANSSDFRKADFSYASLNGGDFTKAKLTQTSINKASAIRAIFDEADLSESSFIETPTDRASFVKANFANAELKLVEKAWRACFARARLLNVRMDTISLRKSLKSLSLSSKCNPGEHSCDILGKKES